MSGITFSLGRSAPGAFQPRQTRVKKKYQGYNGGGTAGFRGLHDASQSALTPDDVQQTVNRWTGLQPGVILVTQVPVGTPDTSQADGLASQNAALISPTSLGLPPGLKLASAARVAIMGVAAARSGGLLGLALVAMAIPDALILWRDYQSGAMDMSPLPSGP